VEHDVPYTPRTYLVVLAVLLVLTAATIGYSFLPLEGVWHIVGGLIVAAVKGGLVVVFFMHALHTSRAARVWMLMACVWLAILFSLTLADYFTRGLVPYMPGH
jgi:cytochrome c oxidase subunit IV